MFEADADQLAVQELSLLVQMVVARCGLLYRLLELLQQAAGPTLRSEVDTRRWKEILYWPASSAETVVRPLRGCAAGGGLSILHMLVIGSPPQPAAAKGPVSATQAAASLADGELYRVNWSFQIEPLLETLLIHAGGVSGDQQAQRALINAKDDHGQLRC